MSHFVRRIIFWTFTFLFVALTAYFSLKLSGHSISFSSLSDGSYRFNFLQKTGILAVNSRPRESRVELRKNFKVFLSLSETSKSKQLKTPVKVKNLIPGEYFLKIEAPGYWPFERRVHIVSGQTTYVEDVVLLKKTLPLSILPEAVQRIEINPASTQILLNEGAKLFDIKNESEIFLGDDIEKMSFLGNNYLLLNDQKVFSWREGKELSLPVDNDAPLFNFKIDNANLYFLGHSGSLYSYSLLSQDVKSILLADDIVDYYVSSPYLFVVFKNNQQSSLKIYSLKNLEVLKNIEIPVAGEYEIIPSNNNLIFIYEKTFSSLYLIDPFSQVSQLAAVLRNVHDISLVDKNNFIYHSDFEINIFNTALLQNTLISRFPDKINSLLWHPRGYIFFSDDRSIKAIDFKHNKYNVNLFTLDAVSNLVLDKKGSCLYFTGKIANQEGLYKLFIQ